MAVVEELIRVGDDNTLSFGNYGLPVKTKRNDFEFEGDLYKVKTFYGITKLERNGAFVYESLPGTVVEHFSSDGETVAFDVYGQGNTSITLELEADTVYELSMDGTDAGEISTNLGGKLTLSADLNGDDSVSVKIVKK